jgi:hypothetical protein
LFCLYLNIWNVLLYSSPAVLRIYNLDSDYLTTYVIIIILLTCSVSKADASMDFVELQINEMR